jgi:hypothetical protein
VATSVLCRLVSSLVPEQLHSLTSFIWGEGHTQQEHETSHGSMTQTRWAIDGPDGIGVELEGHKFSSNDNGGPMMCNLVCSSMGRHVHIEYCRSEEGTVCEGAEVQHINARTVPDPDRPKDAVTHNLYWRRMGKFELLCLSLHGAY